MIHGLNHKTGSTVLKVRGDIMDLSRQNQGSLGTKQAKFPGQLRARHG